MLYLNAMLTIEFETTDRSQLIARIMQFIETLPETSYLDKQNPLIGIINSKQYGCGKSLIWDIFTDVLLAKKKLEEESCSSLRGNEALLGPEEDLEIEDLMDRNAEMWLGKSKSNDEMLRLHYYNALSASPMFIGQMHNDINNSQHPNVSPEYFPNLVLITNKDRGPTDFLIEMAQPLAIERSLTKTSWQLQTRITIYSERLTNCPEIKRLSL